MIINTKADPVDLQDLSCIPTYDEVEAEGVPVDLQGLVVLQSVGLLVDQDPRVKDTGENNLHQHGFVGKLYEKF